jgi:hypothetical protein
MVANNANPRLSDLRRVLHCHWPSFFYRQKERQLVFIIALPRNRNLSRLKYRLGVRSIFYICRF